MENFSNIIHYTNNEFSFEGKKSSQMLEGNISNFEIISNEKITEQSLTSILFIKKDFATFVDNKIYYDNLSEIKKFKELFELSSSSLTQKTSIVYKLYEKLTPLYSNDKFYDIDLSKNNKEIIINNSTLIQICAVIYKTLDKIFNNENSQESKFEVLTEILKNDSLFIPEFETKSVYINNINLVEYILYYSNKEILIFRLSEEELPLDEDINNDLEIENKKVNFNIDLLLLFSYFHLILFPIVKSAIVDLNIYNNKSVVPFLQHNPYQINDDYLKNIYEEYEDIYLGNYIISDLVGKYTLLDNIKIKMNESYIQEIEYIYNKNFDNWDKYKKKNDIIMFNKMFIENIKECNIEFNALDPILFKNVIEHIVITSTNAELLSISLFCNNNKNVYNEAEFYKKLRKIICNYEYYLLADSKDTKINDDSQKTKNDFDKIINYEYENYFPSNKYYIRDERIPKYLYKEFDSNLLKLEFVLYQLIPSLKGIWIDISPYKILTDYNTYNTSIVLFIFNILYMVQRSSSINKFALICMNLPNDLTMIKKYINRLAKCEINLTNININYLTLGFEDIEYFIPFDKMPIRSLKELEFINMSYNDFSKFCIFYKDNFQQFLNLNKISFSFGLTMDNLKDKIIRFFSLNFASNLNMISIKNENFIDINNIIDIFDYTKKNLMLINTHNFYISYSGFIEEYERFKMDPYLITQFKNIICDCLNKNHFLSTVKSNKYNNSFEIKTCFLDKNKQGVYYKIAECFDYLYLKKIKVYKFQRILSKGDKKYILSKIFGFMDSKNLKFSMDLI